MAEYEQIALSELKPYEKNARTHSDEQIATIINSIREFGFRNPVIIDENNMILAGHGRVMAAERMGLTSVPFVRWEDMTETQKRGFILADNKTADLAGWDLDLLQEELEDIDLDMADFGFDISDLQEPEDIDIKEDDWDETPPEEPKSKRGEIYQLGAHRLMCGDSTSAADMDALMNGEKPVMVFTDPPYGVSIGDKTKLLQEVARKGIVHDNIEGDTLGVDDLKEMLTKAMRNLREHCDDACSYYVSAPQGGELSMMMMMMKDAGLAVRHNLVWVKNNATFSLGRLDYDYRHEPIFYTWTKKHNFYGGFSQTVIDDTTPVDKMTRAQLKELVRALKEEKEQTVIYCDKPNASKLHPTMKPVKLVGRFIHNSSLPGDLIADIFGGAARR